MIRSTRSWLPPVNERGTCAKCSMPRVRVSDQRQRILCDCWEQAGETAWIQSPFFCDYGENIELRERVFFNFNCVVPDVCPVSIGSFSLFGPAAQIHTPNACIQRRASPARG